MAKTSKVSIGVTVTGDGENSEFVPLASPVTNATAPQGGVVTLALTAGDNTLTIPSGGAKGFIFVPPVASANAKTLKGNAADVGIALSPLNPTTIFFTGSPVMIINSAGLETCLIHWV